MLIKQTLSPEDLAILLENSTQEKSCILRKMSGKLDVCIII